MDVGLSNKVVLVTGGSRGIGRATVHAFAAEGARVALTYHTRREAADAVAQEVARDGDTAMAVHLDLADPGSITGAVATIEDRWAPIDVLVNNAVSWGDVPPQASPRFEDTDPSRFRAMVQANLDGTAAVIRAVLPGMRTRDWGRIVNVSSSVSVDGLPGSGPYASAKGALNALTLTLARELGPQGILVNCVLPGLTLTQRNRDRIPESVRHTVAAQAATGRLLVPDDIAPAIVFLGSRSNTAVAGEIVRTSGG
ncbi:MAG: SDR family oxidoreductase [Myxococcales bacterium]|nr:SDR family oxidoreductase [Myxococcales bacterium]